MEKQFKGIGITERGDVEYDNDWIKKFDSVSGVVLISKGMPNAQGREFMLSHKEQIIFHATTTGMGGTVIEPGVKDYVTRLQDVKKLVDEGFPISHVVIRVDPIVPTERGVQTAMKVVAYAHKLGFRRFRYSFLDYYKHAADRFAAAGISWPRTDASQISLWEEVFTPLAEKTGCVFESCAENTRHAVGCISKKDADLMGISASLGGSSHQRKGCLCPACKTELLSRKHPCPHGCLYCYWMDPKAPVSRTPGKMSSRYGNLAQKSSF